MKAIDILTKIEEAYNDKERENNRLFNWKQMETERINNEIKLLEDQAYQKINYLKIRLEHLREEEKNGTDKFVSDLIEQHKTDNSHSDNFYVQLEQNYQTKLSELNLKLKQISKYEAEKDNLVKELIEVEKNRIKDWEEYVKGRTDIRYEDIANVVRVNSEFRNAKEYQKQVSNILAQIISIEQEIEEKKNIESEIAKINYERNSIFGKNKPTPALEQQKYFGDPNRIKHELSVEYNKRESALNDEAQKVASEADEGKAKLEMELARILEMPVFSRVYIREMLDLKIELNKILTEQEVSVKTELNNKKVSRDNIVNPILAELDEKNIKFDNKTQEYLDLTKKLVDESSPKLSEEQINELEKQIDESRKQRIKFKEELEETEKYYNQTLSDIEPLDKEIEKLSKNMESIANIRKMLQVSEEEAKTATIQFTKEEQEEYTNRYDSQKSRIDNIIRFKNSENIFDLTPPIDSTKLGKRM